MSQFRKITKITPLEKISLVKSTQYVQEACAQCFAVHILKFEILQITWKKWNKEHQALSFHLFINKSSIWMLFVLFFSCGLHDLKFWFVNRKAFGASFLYWVDFTSFFYWSHKTNYNFLCCCMFLFALGIIRLHLTQILFSRP